jgi:hypothetical protein
MKFRDYKYPIMDSTPSYNNFLLPLLFYMDVHIYREEQWGGSKLITSNQNYQNINSLQDIIYLIFGGS